MLVVIFDFPADVYGVGVAIGVYEKMQGKRSPPGSLATASARVE